MQLQGTHQLPQLILLRHLRHGLILVAELAGIDERHLHVGAPLLGLFLLNIFLLNVLKIIWLGDGRRVDERGNI